jgi:hypothetical protein
LPLNRVCQQIEEGSPTSSRGPEISLSGTRTLRGTPDRS